MNKSSDYEPTIGIECHVQLKTATKLFSATDNDARDSEPNSCVSEIDFALPGMLPMLNHEAIVLAARAGKALNAKIANVSRFDRKHYFYPDLPKGYQTTQMYQPIILAGFVELPSGVKVRIHHAHLEEDAGKLTHHGDHSLVDLNRAGTPLIEIVSEPDIHSAHDAKLYAQELQMLMKYADVSYANLFHGNMRFDVNVSVARKGATELGLRCEVKNLNSFRSVERAAEYEIARQIDILESGETVKQETRGWHDADQKTFSQRSKEDTQDYRYMPDADIPPVILTDDEIAEMQSGMRKMPHEYRENWRELNLDESVVETVLQDEQLAESMDAIFAKGFPQPKTEIVAGMADFVGEISIDDYDKLVKRIFNWFASIAWESLDMSRLDGRIGPRWLLSLSKLAADGKLSSTGAKEIFVAGFSEEFTPGKMPEDFAKEKNLIQNSNEDEIAKIVDEVLADPASQKPLADIRGGNDKAIGFLVGQIMKKSQGKANPGLAQKLIRERL